jgi:hypothetical protein
LIDPTEEKVDMKMFKVWDQNQAGPSDQQFKKQELTPEMAVTRIKNFFRRRFLIKAIDRFLIVHT